MRDLHKGFVYCIYLPLREMYFILWLKSSDLVNQNKCTKNLDKFHSNSHNKKDISQWYQVKKNSYLPTEFLLPPSTVYPFHDDHLEYR